jgi:hypothetical protein
LRLPQFLREPLIQFLALGGILFLVYAVLEPGEEAPPEQILIDAATIDSLEAAFQATWNRPPTAAERQGLIDDHLAEEVLYREALKLGLNRDDVVIRRRMRQKMEFLLQDSLAADRPDDSELRAYLEENQDRYRDADRLTFKQVFLGANASTHQVAEWRALTETLEGAPQSLQAMAQPSLLPEGMERVESAAIARLFGERFGRALFDAPSGQWSGPVESAYGWHLVWVESRSTGDAPAFEEVRPQIERDVMYEKRKKAETELIERLKQKYEIVVEEHPQ